MRGSVLFKGSGFEISKEGKTYSRASPPQTKKGNPA